MPSATRPSTSRPPTMIAATFTPDDFFADGLRFFFRGRSSSSSTSSSSSSSSSGARNDLPHSGQRSFLPSSRTLTRSPHSGHFTLGIRFYRQQERNDRRTLLPDWWRLTSAEEDV